MPELPVRPNSPIVPKTAKSAKSPLVAQAPKVFGLKSDLNTERE